MLGWLLAPPPDETATIVDRVTTVMSRAAMFLVVFIVAIIFFEVAMRYVFVSPTLWVNELSLWLGSIIYLLAGVYAMQRRAHIRITAIYDIVPRNVQRVFDLLSLLVIVLFAFAMVYASWDVALDTLLRWERFGNCVESADSGDDQAAGPDRDDSHRGAGIQQLRYRHS